MQLQQFLPRFKRPVMACLADPEEIIAAQTAVPASAGEAQAPAADGHSWFDSSFDLRAGLEVREFQLKNFDPKPRGHWVEQ